MMKTVTLLAVPARADVAPEPAGPSSASAAPSTAMALGLALAAAGVLAAFAAHRRRA
jgi:hypothetical protein